VSSSLLSFVLSPESGLNNFIGLRLAISIKSLPAVRPQKKANAKLKALAEELHPTHEIRDVSVTERYIDESIYQASSWPAPRRIVIQSIRPAGELFFSHAFFVTNLSETFSPQAIVESYQQRGTMENFIKEAKNGFGFDQMKSHDFIVNEARMMLSLLTYNFTNWLRTLVSQSATRVFKSKQFARASLKWQVN